MKCSNCLFFLQATKMGQISSTSELKNLLSKSQDSLNSCTFQRKLGLLNGVSMTIGCIIGTGIFIVPKSILMTSGSIGMSLVIWIVSGLVSMLGALCYIELGTTFVKSGGDYLYLRMCYGDMIAFLFMWVYVLILSPVSKAIGSLTFANYVLAPIFLNCPPPPDAVRLIAALLLCLITYVNCRDVQWSARVQDLFTCTKVSALIVVIVSGIYYMFTGETGNFENAFEGTNLRPGDIALSFYSSLYCYGGWRVLNGISEELIDPYTNLPKSICISVPLVTVIYTLTNIAFFAVLTPPEILSSDAVAVTFAEKMLGPISWIMPFFVALSIVGALNGSIFESSRILFVGAREGHLPNFLSMINLNHLTPAPSVLLVCLLSLVYLCTTEIYTLITYLSFVDAFFLSLTIGGMIWLRYKQPNIERPIKVNIAILVAYFIVALFLLLLPFYVRPLETGLGAAITLSGVPVYMIKIYWNGKPVFLTKVVEKATSIIQKILLTVPEEICVQSLNEIQKENVVPKITDIKWDLKKSMGIFNLTGVLKRTTTQTTRNHENSVDDQKVTNVQKY